MFATQKGWESLRIENVRGYIAGQVEHHKKVSYVDELRRLLEEAGVPYDERYLT